MRNQSDYLNTYIIQHFCRNMNKLLNTEIIFTNDKLKVKFSLQINLYCTVLPPNPFHFNPHLLLSVFLRFLIFVFVLVLLMPNQVLIKLFPFYRSSSQIFLYIFQAQCQFMSPRKFQMVRGPLYFQQDYYNCINVTYTCMS